MPAPRADVFQFKIRLQDVKPVVWRRIQVPSTCSFWDLHVAIHDSMGWAGTQPHAFCVTDPEDGSTLELGVPGKSETLGVSNVLPAWDQPVRDILTAENPRAVYKLAPGRFSVIGPITGGPAGAPAGTAGTATGQTGTAGTDTAGSGAPGTGTSTAGIGWEHDVVLERILPAQPGRRYPVCISGRNACPPDEVSGPREYAALLRILANPRRWEYEELIALLGRELDPRAFDPGNVSFGNPRIRLKNTLNPTARVRARERAAAGERAATPAPEPRRESARRRKPEPEPEEDDKIVPLPPDWAIPHVVNMSKLDSRRVREPKTILTDHEVEVITAAMFDLLEANYQLTPEITGMSRRDHEDLLRFQAVSSSCVEAREEMGMTVKQAARAAGLPEDRITAMENAYTPGFGGEDVLAYTTFLGLDKWLKAWRHANTEFAKRLGLPDLAD